MSASEGRENALQQPEKASIQGNYAQKIGVNTLQVSLCEFYEVQLSRCLSRYALQAPHRPQRQRQRPRQQLNQQLNQKPQRGSAVQLRLR